MITQKYFLKDEESIFVNTTISCKYKIKTKLDTQNTMTAYLNSADYKSRHQNSITVCCKQTKKNRFIIYLRF